MIREIKTLKQAAEEWVREMNSFSSEMIEILMQHDIDSWHEITTPSTGDRVSVISENCCGVINRYDDEHYEVELDDDGTIVECAEDDIEIEFYETLPMWGTMWSFKDGCDNWWLSEKDGVRAMSNCGFRVYESDDFGYFFGIDGAGYDFYESHWIPLYKERGFHWHDVDE